ncbi:hypothetical protein [Thermofilum pendens]|uniref:Uncharacterized protein n=1 Tax=Thermofilum pendens (strain DSM 2475 / Hrk 5) TaxID=368408 RepID=A1S1A9_THEPD|nr:hypothetical protein [Thermofilum pendens]ABL79239.1 hypothetical protein Tpen_1844 [Thermofilum pendens Hrk 5]
MPRKKGIAKAVSRVLKSDAFAVAVFVLFMVGAIIVGWNPFGYTLGLPNLLLEGVFVLGMYFIYATKLRHRLI